MAKGAVRLGIIGCGQIGLKHIQRYSGIDGAEIAAVADIKKSARERGSKLAGGAHAFRDFRKLLEVDDLEAVDVCLHNNLHAPVAIEAMRAGKHVYCEKPMAGSYADALAMSKAAGRYRRKLSVQLFTLFSAETKAARRLIDAGALGRCYYAKSVGFRRRGRCYVDGYGSAQFVQKDVAAGGALYDMGVYHIAQVLYLLGNPAARTITGSTYQEIGMYPDRKRNSRFDVEELAVGQVRLAGNVALAIEESWAIHLGSLGHSCVVGDRGGLTLDPLTLHTTQADVELDAAAQVKQADTRWRSVDENYAAFDSAQHHWIATLTGTAAGRGSKSRTPGFGDPHVDTAAVALNTMLISEGIYLSQRLGREVTAAEVAENSKSTAIKV